MPQTANSSNYVFLVTPEHGDPEVILVRAYDEFRAREMAIKKSSFTQSLSLTTKMLYETCNDMRSKLYRDKYAETLERNKLEAPELTLLEQIQEDKEAGMTNFEIARKHGMVMSDIRPLINM